MPGCRRARRRGRRRRSAAAWRRRRRRPRRSPDRCRRHHRSTVAVRSSSGPSRSLRPVVGGAVDGRRRARLVRRAAGELRRACRRARRWHTGRARLRRWWQPAPVGSSSLEVYGRLSPAGSASKPSSSTISDRWLRAHDAARRTTSSLSPSAAASSAMSMPPWWCADISSTNRASASLPVARASSSSCSCVAIPGISDGSTGCPIHAIAVPSSETDGASISSSRLEHHADLDALVEDDRAGDRAQTRIGVRPGQVAEAHVDRLLVVHAHVLEEADVDVGCGDLVLRIGDEPTDHPGDQRDGDDDDGDVDRPLPPRQHDRVVERLITLVGGRDVDLARVWAVPRDAGRVRHRGSLPTLGAGLLRCRSGVGGRLTQPGPSGELCWGHADDVGRCSGRDGALRRHRRAGQPDVRDRGRPDLRADRPQRRRQDDDVQRRQPHLRADLGPGDLRRQGPAGGAGARHRRPRHRQDVPEPRAVPVDEPARERDGRRPQPGSGRHRPGDQSHRRRRREP